MSSANNKTPRSPQPKTGPEFLLTVVFIVCKTHVGSWVKKISRQKAICWMDSLFEKKLYCSGLYVKGSRPELRVPLRGTPNLSGGTR